MTVFGIVKASPKSMTNLIRTVQGLFVALVGLGGGIYIIFYVFNKTNFRDSPTTPFWMLAAGALVFTFVPIVINKFNEVESQAREARLESATLHDDSPASPNLERRERRSQKLPVDVERRSKSDRRHRAS